MISNNSIDAVQRQYIPIVQPVKLFEPNNKTQAKKSSFDFLNLTSQNNIFSPEHPNVKSPTLAKHLDILS